MLENEWDEESLRKIIDETDIFGEVRLPAGWDGYDNDYDDAQTQTRTNKSKTRVNEKRRD